MALRLPWLLISTEESLADIRTSAGEAKDFVVQKLSEISRTPYGLTGAVQHGASKLPGEAFYRFPATGTAQIQ